MPKELQTEARGEIITLFLARCTVKDDLGTERLIEGARCPGPGVNRTGNELPKRLEVLERGVVRIEIMSRCVVKICGDPNRVANGLVLHER